ncbi:MAG: ABC transporter ATP-binding protein, partial [Deltaproteobacteria bacterium]|nr:ABC transporter ATP-binding protein [Deltaproteobacteria bacterium]
MNGRENNLKSLLLEIESVSKTFGGVQAARDISFTVSKGNIVGLIGPNGAGKTTLFNLITGVYTPDSGKIIFEQTEVQGREVLTIVKMGIARTFQNVELFENMTAVENVMVGQHVRTTCGFWGAVLRLPGALKEEKKIRKNALDLLEFVGLESVADRRSSELPFGWQRLLEIARAMASKPKMLLLDEPAAGLNAVETGTLAELLNKIRSQGITLLLVEHDMNLTMEISDRIVVLDQGRLLAHG